MTPALSFLSQGCNLSWPWPSSRRVPRISCSILQILAVGSESKTRLLCHSWVRELLTCSFKYTGSFGPLVFCLFPCGTLKKPCSLSAELLTPESYLCLSLGLFHREPSPSNSQTLVAPSGGQTSFPDPFGDPGVYCPQLAQKAQSLSAMWVAFQDHCLDVFFHEGFAELWDAISLLRAFTECPRETFPNQPCGCPETSSWKKKQVFTWPPPLLCQNGLVSLHPLKVSTEFLFIF